MKKAKYLMSLLIIMTCAMFMTGCMRFSTTVEIKKNGKADVSMLIAYQNSMGEDAATSNDSEIKELEEEGWIYSDYNEDDYIGYVVTKKNVDLKEIAKEMSSSDTASEMNTDKFQITKHGSNYKISWDIMNSGDSSDSQNTDDYSQYASSLKSAGGYMTFVLKLPYKAKSSNATEVSKDGKTLTWDLLSMKQGDKIEVEFSLINWPAIIACIIGALVIIGAVIAVLLILKNKKAAPAGFPGPGYSQNPGFDQNPGYNPNQGYNPNSGYDPNQGYSPNPGYNPNPGYDSNMYGQPQTPTPPQGQSLWGTNPNSYGQPQAPDPNMYGQPQAPDPNMYGQSQAPNQNPDWPQG